MGKPFSGEPPNFGQKPPLGVNKINPLLRFLDGIWKTNPENTNNETVFYPKK